MADHGFEPTKAQKNAIEAHGGAITVSAAAGSGKTRVLVQRVIRHLTENNIPADRLLILTFTNTAAAEMKTRISRAIDDLIKQDPDNDFYRSQQLLLSAADICTIDSYCSRIVKENFFRLGISRDFRIGSETELHELRRRLMSDLIEKYYRPPAGDTESEQYRTNKQQYDAFCTLSTLLTDRKLDSDLEQQLLGAYDQYSSHTFPEQWMNNCISRYDPNGNINDSDCARYLMRRLDTYIRKLRSVFDQAQIYRSDIGTQYSLTKKKMYESALDAYESYEYLLENLEDLYSEDELDISAAADIISGFKKVNIRFGAAKDQNLKNAAALLSSFAEIVEKNMSEYAVFSNEEYRSSNKKILPVIICLKNLLEEFDDKFFSAKNEKGILDFHDLERLMLELLYEKDEQSGTYRRTDFAAELSLRYEEIMVDEYQDTNDIQESIFKAISRNETNLFVVGDVKQSIYRFRDAQPELFKKRCAAGKIYDETNPQFPALIVLDKNFRSRSGIIDSVNYVFGLLMSEDAGEIEYDETQRLTAGAIYPDKDESTPDTEVHFIEYDKQDTDENSISDPAYEDDTSIENSNRAEAVYCARLISQMTENGVQVTESGKLRKAVYGDFCILLRAVKNKAHIYAEELENAGIPACTDTEIDLLERYEVRAAAAWLKSLNNPLSDIDLTAALLCPVSGFTPDELAALKEQPGKRFYKKLRAKADENDSLALKCRRFIDTMRYFRTCAVTMPCDRLLSEFYEKTGFLCAVGAMRGGQQRVRNLRRFVQFAADYENGNSGGLTGFVRHIRYLEESGSGIKVSDNVPANAVRIMTIHHSKGLEFPICILAGTATSKSPMAPRINYHPTFGIGLRALDPENYIPCNTVQYTAVNAANAGEEKSEQLRVLYVAMTRAKEKLIILSTTPAGGEKIIITDESGEKLTVSEKYRKRIQGLAKKCQLTEENRMIPYEVMSCKNYSDWITMCLLVSDKISLLRRQAEEQIPLTVIQSPEIGFRYVPQLEKIENSTDTTVPESPSDALIEKLKTIFANGTNNDISTLIPSKATASTLAHKGIDPENTARMTPDFIKSDKISPTQRGTATHAFLQHMDFHAVYKEIIETGSFENAKQELIRKGLIPPEQAELIIDQDIKAFVLSPLFQRILKSENVQCEYRFTVRIPSEMAAAGDALLKEKLKQTPSVTQSILQGSIDLLWEENDGIVITDYKTDRGKTAAQLTEMYGIQLKLYKAAAEKLFDKPVKECYIYALRSGEAIPVN